MAILTLFLGLTQEYLSTELFMLAESEMFLPYAATEHCLAKWIEPATEQLQFRYFVLVFVSGFRSAQNEPDFIVFNSKPTCCGALAVASIEAECCTSPVDSCATQTGHQTDVCFGFKREFTLLSVSLEIGALKSWHVR